MGSEMLIEYACQGRETSEMEGLAYNSEHTEVRMLRRLKCLYVTEKHCLHTVGCILVWT